MGLFSKKISDDEWLSQVLPLYKTALPLTKALDEAVANEDSEREQKAVQNASQKLQIIYKTIKELHSPSSAEARRAKSHLQKAMKNYSEGIKQGLMFIPHQALIVVPDPRTQSGGISKREAVGRLTYQKYFFEKIIRGAGKSMEEATRYFSKQC